CPVSAGECCDICRGASAVCRSSCVRARGGRGAGLRPHAAAACPHCGPCGVQWHSGRVPISLLSPQASPIQVRSGALPSRRRRLVSARGSGERARGTQRKMQLSKDIAAVVTGGASGLGAATARALAAKGAKVALLDLNAALGEPLAKELGGVFVKG